MAHFIYEYSANLPEESLDLQGLMKKMHGKAAETDIFPMAGMRSRAIKCEDFRVADGDPAKGFLNLSMKVGRGRDEAIRMRAAEMFWEILLKHLEPLMASQPVTVSFEMRELEESVKFNNRNF
ncbi:5-carboxymethyl-2-hydroxymuconate Delta-isomerase [Pseudomonadales bacterium]|nr:5-carboxymethyl-2-hydroxymuconate Delta-isomerase [Pseudomonadales bacterium]